MTPGEAQDPPVTGPLSRPPYVTHHGKVGYRTDLRVVLPDSDAVLNVNGQAIRRSDGLTAEWWRVYLLDNEDQTLIDLSSASSKAELLGRLNHLVGYLYAVVIPEVERAELKVVPLSEEELIKSRMQHPQVRRESAEDGRQALLAADAAATKTTTESGNRLVISNPFGDTPEGGEDRGTEEE
jgi:hypothetical protein